MKLIDTNILVYASVPAFAEHQAALSLLESVVTGTEKYCITWINVFEYLRVVTHPKIIKPAPLTIAKALDNISQLLGSVSILRIDAGPDHLAYFKTITRQAAPVKGNFVHDCRIAAIMCEHGVKEILTRDTDFRKIPNIKVVNPFD